MRASLQQEMLNGEFLSDVRLLWLSFFVLDLSSFQSLLVGVSGGYPRVNLPETDKPIVIKKDRSQDARAGKHPYPPSTDYS